MWITYEGEKICSDQMKNLEVELKSKKGRLRAERKAKVFEESFDNYLLRFIVVDGHKFVADSMLKTSKGGYLRYRNKHLKDTRIIFDSKRHVLRVEKEHRVKNPLYREKRFEPDEGFGFAFAPMECWTGNRRFSEYEINEFISEWRGVGIEIPVESITSMKMEIFEDKPAVWNPGKIYLAYSLIIKTRKFKQFSKWQYFLEVQMKKIVKERILQISGNTLVKIASVLQILGTILIFIHAGDKQMPKAIIFMIAIGGIAGFVKPFIKNNISDGFTKEFIEPIASVAGFGIFVMFGSMLFNWKEIT